MGFAEYDRYDALGLAELVAKGEVTALELVDTAIARIEALNPRLNAVIFTDFDGARERAKGSLPDGPFKGVPFLLKDILGDLAGWPTRNGSRLSPPVPMPFTATLVQRFLAGGLVPLGKTNVPEFGLVATTESKLYGPARNPWNPARTPGGSSGGAAVAVALGMGPIAVGTDGAGSVRIPAAFCGNFGLKPSFGRVPAYPLSPMGTVAHLGPHSMDVRDAALAMNVMKRPDARDWTSLPPNDDDYTAALGKGFAGLRVAWSPRLGYAQVHPEVAAGVQAAVRAIESAGAHVEEVDPGFEDPLEITTGLWFVGSWMVWNTLTPEQQAVTDPDFRAQAELGRHISALHVQQLQARRVDLGSRMRQFMQHYDLLVTPSIAVPAFEIRAPGSVPMTPEAMLSWTPFSYPFNLTQQPACTVPCGLTADGLPIGIQFVGPMFRDDLVLRAGAAYEAIRPIPRPPVLQERSGR